MASLRAFSNQSSLCPPLEGILLMLNAACDTSVMHWLVLTPQTLGHSGSNEPIRSSDHMTRSQGSFLASLSSLPSVLSVLCCRCHCLALESKDSRLRFPFEGITQTSHSTFPHQIPLKPHSLISCAGSHGASSRPLSPHLGAPAQTLPALGLPCLLLNGL